MLARGMDCHTLLQKPKDKEWLVQGLAFLKAFIIHRGIRGGTDDFAGNFGDEAVEFLKVMVAGLEEAAPIIGGGECVYDPTPAC